MTFLFDRALAAPGIGARRSGRRNPLAFLLLCLAATAGAAEETLSMAQAQSLAVARSRELAAREFASAAAREMAHAARQLPDPVLSLGVDNVPLSGPDRGRLGGDFMTMRRVSIAQEWTRADKRQLRGERFEREAQRALAEKAVAAAAIERDTALSWLERYYAEAMLALVQAQLAEARLGVEAAQAAYRGGKGSQAELYAARMEMVNLEDRSRDYGGRAQKAGAMLGRWIGNAAMRPLGARPAFDTVGVDAARLDEQLASHPGIAVLASQEELARTELRLAQASKRADWSLELGYQQRGSGYPDMVSFGVSVPLQWDQKRRQDRDVAARLAQVEQAKELHGEALRQHIGEARALLEEWRSSRERLARLDRELLPLAQQRTSAALAAYRGAKGALAEVIGARRAELDVRLQLLQLEAELARTWVQLAFLSPQEHAAARETKEKRNER
jgi:outer membrane protein TolC